jgi:serine/threonine protein kinase
MQFTKADIYSKYRLGSKLGSGGFSSVRKARDRESRALRAIKTLRKSKMHSAINVDLFVNEILMLRQMDHPHILKIYDLLEDKKYYHVVTEL